MTQLNYSLDLSEEAAEELLPIVFEELIEDYEALDAAVEKGDIESVKSINHKLKGIARSFHFLKLLETCQQLDLKLNDYQKSKTLSMEDELLHIYNAIGFSLQRAKATYKVDFFIDRNDK